MIQVRFWRHRLLVPISSECSEIIIKGSRFLAESFIISSQNQVREILNNIGKNEFNAEYPKDVISVFSFKS